MRHISIVFLVLLIFINITADAGHNKKKRIHPCAVYYKVPPLLRRYDCTNYNYTVYNPYVAEQQIRRKREKKRHELKRKRYNKETNNNTTEKESMTYDNETVAGSTSNGTSVSFNPVTLTDNFTELERLIFLVVCSTYGCLINGFFVSAFFVEHSLKRLGHTFFACLGLSDMIATLVFPIAAIVLLSGMEEIYKICKILQTFVIASTYSYSLFFALTGLDSYFLHCHSKRVYEVFISMRIGIVTILVFLISILLATIGVYLDFDYDYCERSHFGNLSFRIITFIMLHGIPFMVTSIGLILANINICRKARARLSYRRSQRYERDKSITFLHIIAYSFYVITWTPYLIISFWFPGTKSATFYVCVWIGLVRCIFTSPIYFFCNQNFRWAFGQLFNYCCCKMTLSGQIRQRNVVQCRNVVSEVKCHILQAKLNSGNSQRAASTSRETQEL